MGDKSPLLLTASPTVWLLRPGCTFYFISPNYRVKIKKKKKKKSMKLCKSFIHHTTVKVQWKSMLIQAHSISSLAWAAAAKEKIIISWGYNGCVEGSVWLQINQSFGNKTIRDEAAPRLWQCGGVERVKDHDPPVDEVVGVSRAECHRPAGSLALKLPHCLLE